jgi:hypothetical protein
MDPSENLRRRKAREHAKEIAQQVNQHKEEFFQNESRKTDHVNKITHIQMTRNGRFFTTASRDCVTVWQMTPTICKIDSIGLRLSESQRNKSDLLDSITEHNERKKKKEE